MLKSTVQSISREIFLPEVFNSYSKLSDLTVGNEVYVTPVRWNSSEHVLIVECENVSFSIPEEELSIYYLSYFAGTVTPKEICKIFKNRILSAKVCKTSDGEIYLSRRQNMIDALGYFLSDNNGLFEVFIYENIYASHISICELGAGITALIHVSECSNSFVYNATEYLKKHSNNLIIPAKIINYNQDDNYKIFMSYKETLTLPAFQAGECVMGKVTNYISSTNKSGVFVELHPLVRGILNTDGIDVFPSEAIAEKSSHTRPYVIFGKEYPFFLKSQKSEGFKISLMI